MMENIKQFQAAVQSLGVQLRTQAFSPSAKSLGMRLFNTKLLFNSITARKMEYYCSPWCFQSFPPREQPGHAGDTSVLLQHH